MDTKRKQEVKGILHKQIDMLCDICKYQGKAQTKESLKVGSDCIQITKNVIFMHIENLAGS